MTNNKTLEKLTKASIDNSSGMTERVDFDSSVLSQERFYTENEIQTMTEDQFSHLLKEVASRLPKLSDIKNSNRGTSPHSCTSASSRQRIVPN